MAPASTRHQVRLNRITTSAIRHGFNERELERLSKLLKSRAIKESPFANAIKGNEVAHWVQPDLVAQVRFTEWTDDQKLRHPVYLGLRDDKRPEDVVKEISVAMSEKRPREKRLRPERGAKPPREASGGGAPRALRNADRKANKSRGTRAESRQSASGINKAADRTLRHAAGHRSDPGPRSQPQGRRRPASRWLQDRCHKSRKTLLAEAEGDQGRLCSAITPLSRRSSCRSSPIVRS